DLRELNVTRGESLEALQATQARLLQNNTLEDSLVAGSVQAHGKSFRARVAKGKQTVFGPPRATREAAEQDLRELNVTRGESLEALQATQARLFEARGREAIQNDMEQCFQFWFTEGSTEKPLPAKLQRFAAEGTGSELVSAERLLMEDFWLVEKVAQQPGVEWLQDLGLVLRLDYGSRPTGTSGLATSTSWAGLRSLGNTCYVNSLVQCFRACGPLRKDIGSAEDEKGSLGKLLSSLLHRLAENRWDFLAPFELVSELHRAEPIKFQVGEAAYSDVSECCATLLRTCVTDQNLILANQAHPEQGIERLEAERHMREQERSAAEKRARDAGDHVPGRRGVMFAETLKTLMRLSSSYRRCHWKSASEILFPILYQHLTFASHRTWKSYTKKAIFFCFEAWRRRYGDSVLRAQASASTAAETEPLLFRREGLDDVVLQGWRKVAREDELLREIQYVYIGPQGQQCADLYTAYEEYQGAHLSKRRPEHKLTIMQELLTLHAVQEKVLPTDMSSD
ncbi:Ubiquitin carboxyl-terminal hydrolase, partial [Durusdinium trenchii]